MVRGLVVLLITMVAVVASAADTGVRVTITGLPALPPGTGPVKLTDVLGRMVRESRIQRANRLEVEVKPERKTETNGPAAKVSGPATFVEGSTVASF